MASLRKLRSGLSFGRPVLEFLEDPDQYYPLRTDAVDTTPSRFRSKVPIYLQ